MWSYRMGMAGGLLGVALASGIVACQREAAVRSGPPETAATIVVEAGNGRLAGGEEYRIAEWRSGGSGPQAFADFRGQDGGPTLDLSLSGLGAPGTYACGSSGVGLELRVDVNNAYVPAADVPCTLEVRAVDGGYVEGRYAATLRHTGNPNDEMTVSGTFRASRTEIAAAKAPKLGLP